jgi:hypothetical protein
MPPQEIQQGPLVTEDLTPFRGTWVAIRDGKVIASALDPVELRDRDDVREDDYLVVVPSELVGTYLL